MASAPADRRERLQVLLCVLRLFLARRLNDFPVVAQEAQRLLAVVKTAGAAELGLGEDLRAAALISLGIAEVWALRFDDAERHLEQGVALARRTGRPYLERTLRTTVEPAAGMSLRYARAVLELAGGRYHEALAAFRGAEKLAMTLARPQTCVTSMRSRIVQTLVRLGQTGRAGQVLAELGEDERASAEMRSAVAALRLATDAPQAAADALAPVLDGSVPGVRQARMVTALLLEARARDALGDHAGAGRALERALDITHSNGIVLPFLLDPVPVLLQQHRQHRSAHPALISQILNLLPTPTLLPARQEGAAGHGEMASSRARAGPGGSALRLTDPLSRGEIRVLRYMPTNLSTPEIARELSVSVHTVRTHVRHLFAKLGAHSRTEAVARARTLGLLTPSHPLTRPAAHSQSGHAA